MSNIPQGCKPFNYEEAIKDITKVVTRDGDSIIELKRYDNAIQSDNIVVVTQDAVYTVDKSGVFINTKNNPIDLFLLD